MTCTNRKNKEIPYYKILRSQDEDDGEEEDTEASRMPMRIREAVDIRHPSEGGMIQLEALVELKFLNSSFSSLSSY